MPNDEKKSTGFQTAQPKIPGVPEREVQAVKPTVGTTPESQASKPTATSGTKIPVPYLWAAGGGAILVLVIAVAWWAHGVSGAAQVVPMPAATAPAAQPTVRQPTEKLPVAPGAIATTSEMQEPWSTRKFLYHYENGDLVPALLVHLHGDNYWAISLREPFGTCELEFANVDRLKDYYNLRSKYPMIGDPCTRTVYDLTQYGSGPNGLVRGEVVAGTGSRPPLAIEVQVEGQKIVASRSE
jgi:hypothetical protein